MGLRVYPLYPRVKRWLRIWMAVYAMLSVTMAYGLYRQYHDPHLNVVVLLGDFYALCAVCGLVLTVHLYVLGVPPPEGMIASAHSSGAFTVWREVTRGEEVKRKGLGGDEAQPVSVVIPLLCMVLVTFFLTIALYGLLLKLVEKLTQGYTSGPRAVKPLRVLLCAYGLLGVAFGVFAVRAGEGEWAMPTVFACLGSLSGFMTTAYALWQSRRRPQGEPEKITVKQRVTVGDGRRGPDFSVRMDSQLLVSMIPLALVCGALNVGVILSMS